MKAAVHPTCESLLDAAEALFAARGYAAVSVRDIAEQAGANIAAVSYHFGSKAELYLQTVDRAMQRRESMPAWQLLETTPASREEATATIVRFIHELVRRVLTHDQSPACRLIMHEAAGPSDALDSVVNHYLRPHEELLTGTLRVLLPEADEERLLFTVHSVLGQVLHYVMLRPVIERLSLGSVESSEKQDRLGEHIARFSLHAIGCTPHEVARAIAAVHAPQEAASHDTSV